MLLISFNVISQSHQEKLDSLYQGLQQTKQQEKRLPILNSIAEEYLSINLDSSVTIFKRVAELSKNNGDRQLEFQAYNGLGKGYTSQSKHDSAKIALDRAEGLIAENDSYDSKTKLWMNQGILFFHLSDYENAKQKFQKILDLALIENNLEDMSRCYNNIALCNQYTGSFESALKMHIESAKIAESQSDTASMAKSYNNIGLVYLDLGNYDKSESYMLKSLKLKESLGDKVGMVGAYLNLGSSFRKLGIKNNNMDHLNKAKNYLEMALSNSLETNYGRGVNNAYVNLALVETTMENFDKGIEYGKKAVALSSENGYIDMEMAARLNLGDTYRFKGQLDLAEDEMLKGLDMAKETNSRYIEREALIMLKELYVKRNNYKKALNYHERYIQLKDSMGSVDILKNVDELEKKYETEKKERDLAETRANLAESELKVKKKNTMIYGSLGLALVLGLLGYLFFNQQKLKNRQLKKEGELKTALARIETQNKLQEQRLRISRDLHDNIGSQLTFVTSSVDNLNYGLKDKDEAVSGKLSKISEFTTQTIYELRDTIWAMNKNSISCEDLQIRVSNFIEKARTVGDTTKFYIFHFLRVYQVMSNSLLLKE